MHPKISINIEKLRENVITLKKIANEHGIEPFFVTKVVTSDPEILKHLTDLGVEGFADSRVKNLKKIKDFKEKKLLLRIPQISELEELVDVCDITLISEEKTIRELDRICEKKHKKIEVILMTDLGDLREGAFSEDELYKLAQITHNLKNINLAGLGANLTCYGAIIPSVENLTLLAKRAEQIEKNLNIQLKYVSGISSNGIVLLKEGKIPQKINQARFGESTFIGTETAYGNPVPELNQDVATLTTEIIELKKKPSLPIGESGQDAFGQKPVFEDKGERLRAIVAIGKQDTELDSLTPIDEGISILGASSDHLILDVTDCKRKLDIGDTISFKVGYSALLRAFTSEFIEKEYI